MSNFSVDGLVTGLNTSSIIESLMRIERAPETVMVSKKAAFDAQASAWNDINTALGTLATAANDLLTAQKLSLYAASSSSPTVATATVTAGAAVSPTSLNLRVDALATAQQVASAGAASAVSALGAGRATLGAGLPALGIDYARANVAMNAGAHAVVVTQATGAATITGGMWAGSVSIGPANNEVTVEVNGVTRIVQIAQGTYSTLQALAGAVGVAIGVDVNVSAAGGALQLSTVAEGSAATLRLTGGSALASLGLSAGPTASGTNGIVSVDGVANTITSAVAGTQVTLNGASGQITANLSGGLRAGSGTVHVIQSAASDSLTDLAADISAADSSVRTQTIDIGSGTNPVRLVATATNSGLAKAFTLDLSGYTGVADGTDTLTAGRDASVRIGGLSVQRATNTITDLVPGVSISLQSAQPNTEVAVTVSRDTAALAAKAKSFVDTLNNVLTRVGSLTKYDADKKQASVLTGDSRASDIVSSLTQSLQFSIPNGTMPTLSSVGITFQRNGTFALDQTKLTNALNTDYDGVVKLLARTGQATDSRLSFVAASPATVSDSTPYDVVVTQAAEQATLTGTTFTTLAADEDITVTSWTGTVTYKALAGSTPESVAAGLNTAFANARAGITAGVSGGAVTLTTNGYGVSASLNVIAGASGLTGSDIGVNVAGTIDGHAAQGAGQLLTAATTAGNSAGLSVKVTATSSDVAGAGGSLNVGGVTYSSGAFGSLSSALSRLTGLGGKVTAAHDGAVSASKSQQERIDYFEQRLELVQRRYTRQFAALETLMGQLKNQSSWLASQIAGLPGASQ